MCARSIDGINADIAFPVFMQEVSCGYHIVGRVYGRYGTYIAAVCMMYAVPHAILNHPIEECSVFVFIASLLSYSYSCSCRDNKYVYILNPLIKMQLSNDKA